MISSLNLRRISCPSVKYDYGQHFSGNAVTLSSSNLRRRRLHNRCLASLSTNSSNSSSFRPSVASSTTFTTSVGSPPPIPPLTQWNLTQRHIIVLNFIACAAAISATWLFCSAIPTLLAFKRAAESLEKLLDVTREELPDTMAAVRLSGMEISDLTMELSDLGQEITQGVKSSTRAVRLAEERLRRLTNMNPSASVQMVVPMTSEPAAGPVVARTARGIRETIVKSRAFMQMFFTITQFSKVAFKYLTSRAKSNA
ncbi:uncharacterized protein LOC112515513 isoform X1 [Cynara cardunculus var. scolymus]|uniref:uncharacterized protein LOC112515513 isoform X1 n=1 Tax=Cynara cardunculus var. scolymus TaxID=59895 RepID=UPI000D630932|nr:uncharacterized protein LOC112515513 isoform X1 [Cynara cardunculus var. scolymus]